MNSLTHGVKSWLGGLMTKFVSAAYLVGLLVGTATFFAGRELNNTFLQVMSVVALFSLSAAVEVHQFLSQQQHRAASVYLKRLLPSDERYEMALKDAKDARNRFIAVMSFSAFNSISFQVVQSRPSNVGEWLAAAARGAVIPVLFYLAAHLQRPALDAADILTGHAESTLTKTMHRVGRQWGRRLKDAKKQNKDLTPMAIALLEDAKDFDSARRMQLMHAGLLTTEERGSLKGNATKGVKSRDLYLPSSQAASGTKARRLTPAFEMQIEGQKGDEKVHFEPSKRLPRRAIKLTPRQKVHRHLDRHPDATNAEIVKATKVSNNTVKKYRAEWEDAHLAAVVGSVN